MRWLVVGALAVLIGAVAFLALSSPEPHPDVVVLPSSETDSHPVPPVIAARIEEPAGPAAVEPSRDAGPSTEVSFEIELFAPDGHAAGVGLRFETAYDGGRQKEGSTTTNVMGFARIELEPETYEVSPPTDPPRVTVDPATRHVELRLQPRPIEEPVEGRVVDEQGQPVKNTWLRWTQGSLDQAVAHVDTDEAGRFSFRTSAKDVVLVSRNGFAKHVRPPVHDVTVLELARPARVLIVGRGGGDEHFLQFERGGDVLTLRVLDRATIALPPGHLELDAQSMHEARVLKAHRALDLRAGKGLAVYLDYEEQVVLRLNVESDRGLPVAGAAVRAVPLRAALTNSCPALAADSAVSGTVSLIPDCLRDFNPAYELYATGPWRNVKPELARIDDPPKTLVVRPFNAATDSTDGGPELR